MHTFRKIGEGVLLGGICFMLFIAVFEHLLQLPAWLQVAGRMHPMFLHFPIVLLLLSFFSLWLPVKEKGEYWLNILRLMAALSAMVTASMGLLLSIEHTAGEALTWHKWLGVGVALTGFIFYHTYTYLCERKNTGKIFTVAASIIIIFTGHYGANLTHGDNYLLAPVSEENKMVALEDAIAYNDIIKPILDKKCGACHSASSIKGGLLLTDSAGIVLGGKTGPLFITGKPELSLMMQRIHLPVDDKHHMPPKAKAQLSDEEIALLHAWIQSGAVFNKKIIALPKEDSFRVVASGFLLPSTNNTGTVYAFEAAKESDIQALNNNYRVLEPLGKGSPALAVHFYGISKYSSASLKELLKVKDQVTELSLSRMPVTDGDMDIIKQFKNLETLNLNFTDVTDAGIQKLTGMQQLQSVSIAGTKATISSLKSIAALPQLTRVTIWNTNIDSAQLAILKKTNAKINYETGFSGAGDTIALSTPVIKRAPGIFYDTAIVTMEHPFKDVEIRYTLDGTDVDSLKSNIYSKPVIIKKDTKLQAKAFKKGWYGSPDAEVDFVKGGFIPDSFKIITPIDISYKLQNPNILIDKDLGDLSFNNGKYFGFRMNDAGFLLQYNNPVKLNEVLLNTLLVTAFYIFPPVKIEVYGGMEVEKMQLLGSLSPVMPTENKPSEMLQFIVPLKPAEVKYIRIVAKHLPILPPWHAGKGQPAWVFISEIVAR